MTLISHLLLDDDGLYQASVEIDSAHVNTVTGSPGQDDDGRLDRPGTSSDAIVSAGHAIFSTAAGEARAATPQPGTSHSSEPMPIESHSTAASGGDAETEMTTLSERNLKFINDLRNPNTMRKIDQAFKRFSQWMETKENPSSLQGILEMDPVLLDQFLGAFLIDLRGTDKSGRAFEYEPDTLSSYLRGIAKKLELAGYGHDIFKDSFFKTTRNVLASKRRSLKQQGKGNKPNRADAVSLADEEKLWELGVMGMDTPESLLNLLWFATTKLLGFRGVHETRQLRWGDFEWVMDNNGQVNHIVWTERETKTRHGNNTHRAFAPKLWPNTEKPGRCPVRAMELYRDKRPAHLRTADSPFYLAINYNRPKVTSVWFKGNPMGVDTIGKFMRRMSAKAGLVGRFTNHSVRRSMCTQLVQAGVDSVLVTQLSGHKSVNSISGYATASLEQQQDMAKILRGERDRCNHLALRNPVPCAVISRPRALPPLDTPALGPLPAPGSLGVVPSGNAVASGVPQQNVQSMAMSLTNRTQGMFSGAVFHGQVNITINNK